MDPLTSHLEGDLLGDLSRRLRDLERDRSPRLLLDDHGALADGPIVGHLTEAQLCEVAASEFGNQGDDIGFPTDR